MQYIPLADLFAFLGEDIQVIPREEKHVWETRLELAYQSGRTLRWNGKSITPEEARNFLGQLTHSGLVVFDQWILQSKGLSGLLEKSVILKNDFERKLIEEHRLFADFSDFISPFLLPLLLQKVKHGTEQEILTAAGYINLLNQDSQLILQQRMDAWLKSKLQAVLESARNAPDEKGLIAHAGPVLSDDFIAFINHFTKAFYATRIFYIDSILQVLDFRGCSHRAGYWIAGQLKKLQLNPEHLYKIASIAETVKKGKISFRNKTGKITGGMTAGRKWQLAFVVVCFAALFWIWKYDPFAWMDRVPQIAGDDLETSFSRFTKEERIRMDSLIRSIDPVETPEDRIFTDRVKDPYLHLPPVDMDVNFRTPYKNVKMEKFHVDCVRDQELLEQGLIDSCAAYKKHKAPQKLYPDFRKLAEKKGKKDVFLKNTTIYQVLVLVFRNESEGEVFSALLPEDGSLNFKMNPAEIILFLPGNDWGAFHTSSRDASIIPSAGYKHHFCATDEYFNAMLFEPYKMKSISAQTVKLLLNESSTARADFLLVDLYQALEPLQ